MIFTPTPFSRYPRQMATETTEKRQTNGWKKQQQRQLLQYTTTAYTQQTWLHSVEDVEGGQGSKWKARGRKKMNISYRNELKLHHGFHVRFTHTNKCRACIILNLRLLCTLFVLVAHNISHWNFQTPNTYIPCIDIYIIFYRINIISAHCQNILVP